MKALCLVAVMLAVWAAPEPIAGQSAPRLVIVEPQPGRYLSGRQLLRAKLEPEQLKVVRVMFAADGNPVCARQSPPWECE